MKWPFRKIESNGSQTACPFWKRCCQITEKWCKKTTMGSNPSNPLWQLPRRPFHVPTERPWEKNAHATPYRLWPRPLNRKRGRMHARKKQATARVHSSRSSWIKNQKNGKESWYPRARLQRTSSTTPATWSRCTRALAIPIVHARSVAYGFDKNSKYVSSQSTTFQSGSRKLATMNHSGSYGANQQDWPLF